MPCGRSVGLWGSAVNFLRHMPAYLVVVCRVGRVSHGQLGGQVWCLSVAARTLVSLVGVGLALVLLSIVVVGVGGECSSEL